MGASVRIELRGYVEGRLNHTFLMVPEIGEEPPAHPRRRFRIQVKEPEEEPKGVCRLGRGPKKLSGSGPFSSGSCSGGTAAAAEVPAKKKVRHTGGGLIN